MKMLYMTSISYPSRLANRIQTVEMAKKFDSITQNFVLGGYSIGNLKGVREIKNFTGSVKSFLLGFKYAWYINKKKITHLFCREEKLLFFTIIYLKFLGYTPKTIFEVHDIPQHSSYIFFWVLKRVDKIIVLTHPAKEDLIRREVEEKKIFVAPDGTDASLFKIKKTKEDARRTLSLPLDKKIIIYTGHLYLWKGVQTLIDAGQHLSDNSCIYFIGGSDKDIKLFRDKYFNKKNIIFVGYVPHEIVPLWLWSADVLVLPNSGKEKISSRYTSPLKLFEYMMAERPIVASDLPSIRDILNNQNAYFFEPDNPTSLSSSIKYVMEHEKESLEKSLKAFNDAHLYTWDNRAKKILDFIK